MGISFLGDGDARRAFNRPPNQIWTPQEKQMAPITLGQLQTGPRGNKSAPLLCGKEPCSRALPATTTPFDAGVYGDNTQGVTRLNLELRCGSEAYQSFMNEVDEAVLKALSTTPQDFFPKGKKMSPEDVQAVYKKSSTVRGEHEPTVRCKINTVGPGAVRCWTPEKVSRALPEDWRQCSITPIITAKAVWFMAGPTCGVTYEVNDCIISETCLECPF
jgi:hypothetical protein